MDVERATVRRPAGPLLLSLSFACLAVVQLLGPGATEAPLGAHDNPRTPPFLVHTSASPWLVTALLVVAALCGAAVVWLGLMLAVREWVKRREE